MKTNVFLRLGALGSVLALLFGAAGGCQQDSSSEPALLPAAQPLGGDHAPKQTAQQQLLLPWGNSDAQLRLRPAGAEEQLAMGPSAVAIATDGAALILDRLAGRIAHVGPSGSIRTATKVPLDSEDLCASASGFMATFSPVRATAWVFDPSGLQAGQIKVPRSFRELLHVELGASNMLSARTAYQELFEIGSPSHPLPLAVALRSKREGAVLLADGQGVTARIDAGQATLSSVRQASERGGRSKLQTSHTLPGPASAARIVGSYGDIVCARIEHVSAPSGAEPASTAAPSGAEPASTAAPSGAEPASTAAPLPAAPYEGPVIEVARRVVCVSMGSGKVTLDTALEPVGLYLPRRELAMGSGRLVFIHPQADGLRLRSWKLRAEVTP